MTTVGFENSDYNLSNSEFFSFELDNDMASE